MPRNLFLAILVFTVTIPAGAIAKPQATTRPYVRLADAPTLSLLPRPPVSDIEKRRIRVLIDSFATLDKPDFGLSPTMSGTAFAPLPSQQHPQAFLLTDHGLEGSSALKDLVTLGPDALPFLLDALDDKTPTRIVIKHDSFFGGMWFAREMEVNPANPAEKDVAKELAEEARPEEKGVDAYTVEVGDVCFVAIGQIVGRGYEAVRYQPTACIVLNSPTQDAKLCARVRAIWKSDDPARKLFDSLRADYATQGIYNGKSLDGWSDGSDRQCSAALRLLFYFPKESARLLADRLDKLDVGKDADGDAYERRCVANAVQSDDFLKSVSWSQDPMIRAALARVFKRAGNVLSLMAALPGVDDDKLARQQLEAALIALPGDDPGPYGDGYALLKALVQRSPATAKAMFDRYLQFPTVERRHTVCVALRDVRFTDDVEILLPILSDQRTFGWDYAIVPGQNEPRLPIRVCDEAAVTLSQNHPMLKFVQAGQYADMDKQISAMREVLKEQQHP